MTNFINYCICERMSFSTHASKSGLLILSALLVSSSVIAAPGGKKSAKEKAKELAKAACIKATANALDVANSVAGKVAGTVAGAIEALSPAEAIKAGQVLLVAKVTESKTVANAREIDHQGLTQSIADSSLRSNTPVAKLYDHVFDFIKMPEETRPNETSIMALLRISSLNNVEPKAAYDVLMKFAEIQGEEASLDLSFALVQLAVAYKKTPEIVWKKYKEIEPLTAEIAAKVEEVRAKRAEGMDALSQLLTMGIRVGDAPTTAPMDFLVALTEASLAKGLSAQEVVSKFAAQQKHDRVASYTHHEQISLFKAQIFRGRPITETFPAIQKVETLAHAQLGNALSAAVEKPLMNIVLMTGMPPEEAMGLVKSMMDSPIKPSEEWEVSALFNRILLERDRSPEVRMEAAFPLHTGE